MGRIVWTDITVPNAAELRDFYAQVFGWNIHDTQVDDHIDFTMLDPVSGDPVVGICHALGANAALPPQWLNYFSVADLDKALKTVEQLGGKQISPIRDAGGMRFCAIQDPAGAVCALMEMGN
jgi:predicted enzyme related to lactoylglutathione lyase